MHAVMVILFFWSVRLCTEGPRSSVKNALATHVLPKFSSPLANWPPCYRPTLSFSFSDRIIPCIDMHAQYHDCNERAARVACATRTRESSSQPFFLTPNS